LSTGPTPISKIIIERVIMLEFLLNCTVGVVLICIPLVILAVTVAVVKDLFDELFRR
jgi:hypothetical protein